MNEPVALMLTISLSIMCECLHFVSLGYTRLVGSFCGRDPFLSPYEAATLLWADVRSFLPAAPGLLRDFAGEIRKSGDNQLKCLSKLSVL